MKHTILVEEAIIMKIKTTATERMVKLSIKAGKICFIQKSKNNVTFVFNDDG